MKHRVKTSRFGRNTNQAKWLYRSLASEVLEHGLIQTSKAKAKAVRGLIDKLINLGKDGSVSARRIMIKELGSSRQVEMICKDVAPKLTGQTSGYTRIIKMGPRLSDTSEMVLMELVNFSEVKPVATEVVETKGDASVEKIQEAVVVEKPVKKISKPKTTTAKKTSVKKTSAK
jgi:large subunit ribosomal protein L17